jgi:hypothetical protein
MNRTITPALISTGGASTFRGPMHLCRALGAQGFLGEKRLLIFIAKERGQMEGGKN